MGGGGKGGSSSQSAEIPQYIEDAQKEAISRSQDLAKVGYMPWMGPDVAAFNPAQEQAMQNTGAAASAFGLAPDGMNVMQGMPEAQDFGGGMMGYSSYPMYQRQMEQFRQNAPGQYEAYQSQFVDPGGPQFGPQDPNAGQAPAQADPNDMGGLMDLISRLRGGSMGGTL